MFRYLSSAAAITALFFVQPLGASFPSPPLYPSFSSSTPQVTKIDPPGTAGSNAAYAINSKGQIAGYYSDDVGAQHGYIREANGTYVLFDAPDAVHKARSGTIVYGLNAGSETTGTYNDSTGAMHSFVRTSDGKITEFDPPKAINSAPTGINDKGLIVGYYSRADEVDHGFLRGSGGRITPIDPPGSKGTNPKAINQTGVIAGQYISSTTTPQSHGFVRSADGEFSTFDPPGSHGTEASGINDNGAIVGAYSDGNGVVHGYIRHENGSITIIDEPHAGKRPPLGGTVLSAINDVDATAGTYNNDDLDHAFFRSADGVFTVFQLPMGSLMASRSLNKHGAIVGYYIPNNGDGVAQGFLYAP
jgi:uncharacterized membrane protein